MLISDITFNATAFPAYLEAELNLNISNALITSFKVIRKLDHYHFAFTSINHFAFILKGLML